MVQLSHPYMTTGKTIALTRGTFVGKVMSLLFNMLSRLVINFSSMIVSVKFGVLDEAGLPTILIEWRVICVTLEGEYSLN